MLTSTLRASAEATSTQATPSAATTSLVMYPPVASEIGQLDRDRQTTAHAARSSDVRSQCARVAAAAYVSSRNSSRTASGAGARRTSSYGSTNSPRSRLKNADDGRTVAPAKPSGVGYAYE